MDYFELVDLREQSFSDFARHSRDCEGRKNPISLSRHRTEFERDNQRVLHSLAFRRLKHKTQVFFNPRNDHICTRMEHALHVASISSTICNHLRLNTDLAEAIALAHDLGHAPFGHIGETVLNELHGEYGLPPFMHESHSLRVIDRFVERDDTLNLTYEVRDGVVCHCGEEFTQYLSPDRSKDIKAVGPECAKKQKPATLEGCVVRVADRIAYLGRDFEDAIDAEIVQRNDLPESVKQNLGETNGDIIGSFIYDVVTNSQEIDSINLSESIFSSMDELRQFNYEKIYNSRQITEQFPRIDRVLRDLFERFLKVTKETMRGKEIKNVYHGYFYQVFYEFLEWMQYSEEEPDAQIASDFIAGMTDVFAIRTFQDFFLIIPPV